MNQSKALQWTSVTILYVLTFLLMYEWLVPIVDLTGTGHFSLILFFVILCLITNFITFWPSWCTMLLKLAVIGYSIFYIYGHLDVGAIPQIVSDMIASIPAIFTGDLSNVADSLKMLLFFALIWMTVYLVHHWLTVKHTIFLFLFLTIFFLAALDTFTEYNANGAIVRVLCIGLFLAGMLFIEKVFIQHHMYPTLLRYLKLILPLLLMVGLSAAFAYAMPKKEPLVDLPKPIEKLDQLVKSWMTPVGKVGYVEDDSKLGGSFEEDDAKVFNVQTNKNQYLRVDTKYIYTGKGWERKSGDVYVNSFDYNKQVPLSIKPRSKKNTSKMTIQSFKQYQFIAQPYGLYTIDKKGNNNRFYVELDTEKIRPTKNEQKIALKTYTMNYSSPSYKQSVLDQSKMEDLATLDSAYDKYLQLPDALPQRVGELTAKIVEDEDSVYDRAHAIESYFRVNGYTYSRKNVPYPSKEQDYVDQFLFDTKVGYCDNFSTAMVVMLRTQGIPARWVKGFSNGDEASKGEFVVTNNNAHSWVEAYIPGVGWMQFEPTIGFNDFNQIVDDTKKESTPSNQTDSSTEQEETPAAKQDEPKQPTQDATKEKKEPATQKADRQATASWSKWIVIGIIVLCIFIAYVVWRRRKKWLPRLVLMRYRSKQSVPIEQAYNDLLKMLALANLKKQQSETLQQFAKRVDGQFGEHHMQRFTQSYERHVYDPNTDSIQWDELKESWQYLINSVRG